MHGAVVPHVSCMGSEEGDMARRVVVLGQGDEGRGAGLDG
eukprot:CAMPEP_0202913784 /NCGR_PEP_ID=MMETSP1392-20130828/61495_1 /ASSEMBLY_ACC=CAM_ASM_000868 /TAXON_ID=225041 /ORGANISM="Chlamydomonas chlamydogama, Strain SAG 11-48b" /LENGTH=39 /DNA_ID= /DNA_START= /DNA_END= /DNA_ORIENTATION=